MKIYLGIALIFVAASCSATTVTYSSCTDGTITLSPCSTDFKSIEGIFTSRYEISATAGTSFTSTPSRTVVSAGAEAFVAYLTPTPLPSIPAVAHASDTETLYTLGPVRPGVLRLEVTLFYLHHDYPGGASVTISDGASDYVFMGGGGVYGPIAPINCDQFDCLYRADLPFQLGSTFVVNATADAQAFNSPELLSNGAETFAQVALSLFEADGRTVVPELVEVPEPATTALVLPVILGLIFACPRIRIARS